MNVNVPWWFPFGRVEVIAPRELASRLRNGGRDLQLIDVRSAIEYAESHVANTRNIPITELRERLADLNLDPARPVIAICLS